MDERRREHRGRTLRSGKILFNNKRSVIDCVVRNLSDGGACLQVNSTGGIPPSFELLVDGEAASRPCQLMWLSDNRAGIEFREPDMAHDGHKASADHKQPSPAQSPVSLQANSRSGADILRGELLTVRAALDEVPVGIVLLDTDTRAQFINGDNVAMTVSIGIAGATVSMSGVGALRRLADKALYEAKAAGRNSIRGVEDPERRELRAAAE